MNILRYNSYAAGEPVQISISDPKIARELALFLRSGGAKEVTLSVQTEQVIDIEGVECSS